MPNLIFCVAPFDPSKKPRMQGDYDKWQLFNVWKCRLVQHGEISCVINIFSGEDVEKASGQHVGTQLLVCSRVILTIPNQAGIGHDRVVEFVSSH